MAGDKNDVEGVAQTVSRANGLHSTGYGGQMRGQQAVYCNAGEGNKLEQQQANNGVRGTGAENRRRKWFEFSGTGGGS